MSEIDLEKSECAKNFKKIKKRVLRLLLSLALQHNDF